MKSCLIVKTSAIGDVIQTFPVLEYLRRRFPSARIDWVAEKGCIPLLSSHPLLDQAISIDTKKWRSSLFERDTWQEIKAWKKQYASTEYDLLFDLQGNTKSALITWQAMAKEKVGFGRASVAEKPNLLATHTKIEVPKESGARDKYLQLVQTYFNDKEPFSSQGIQLILSKEEEARLEQLTQEMRSYGKKVFMLNFCSKWANKQLPEELLLRFLSLVEEKTSPLILFVYSSKEEKKSRRAALRKVFRQQKTSW